LTGHISTDELARYRAGVVRAGRAARISVHLAGCSQCSGLDAQIESVSVMLAAVPAPTMPDIVAQRLQAMLASEATRRATSPTSPSPGSSLPVAAPARQRRGWRLRMPEWSSPVVVRSLAATGAVAVLAGGGLLLATLSSGGTASVSARPAVGPVRRASSGVAIPGNSSINAAGTMPVRYYTYGRHSAVTNVVVSDANFTKSDLVPDVRARLNSPLVVPVPSASPAAPSSGPDVGSTSSGNRPRGVTARQLAGCLSKVAAGRRIVLAEVARYLARPATIVVLKPVDHVFDVIVVGSACSAANSDVITRLSLPGG